MPRLEPDANEHSQALGPGALDYCLKRSFPEAGAVITTARKRLDSFHHDLEAVSVKVVDDSGGESQADLFVRVYRGDISWSDLHSTKLPSREWAAWNLAQRLGLPLPTTLWHGWCDQNAVAVQRHLAGDQLQRARNDAAIVHCARLLAQMHSFRPRPKDQEQLVDARTDVLLSRLHNWASEARDTYARRVIEALRSRFADVDQRPAGMLHGDCHLGNFISDGSRVTAIVDWEECSFGDPRLDIGLIHQDMQRMQFSRGWLRRRRFARKTALFLKSYVAASGGEPLGDLQCWHDLIDARTTVVSAWLTERAKSGLSYPPTNLAGWQWMATRALQRLQQRYKP